MDEDRARSRKDNAAENLAILRRLALNLLRTDPDKSSLRGKIKKAGWHDQYLLNLLAQIDSPGFSGGGPTRAKARAGRGGGRARRLLILSTQGGLPKTPRRQGPVRGAGALSL